MLRIELEHSGWGLFACRGALHVRQPILARDDAPQQTRDLRHETDEEDHTKDVESHVCVGDLPRQRIAGRQRVRQPDQPVDEREPDGGRDEPLPAASPAMAQSLPGGGADASAGRRLLLPLRGPDRKWIDCGAHHEQPARCRMAERGPHVALVARGAWCSLACTTWGKPFENCVREKEKKGRDPANGGSAISSKRAAHLGRVLRVSRTGWCRSQGPAR